MENRPDSWVIIKVKKDNDVFYKVLAGWASSYLYGSSWRMNSGIKSAEYDNEVYRFIGESGSVYVCSKHTYGLRMSTVGVWGQLKERYPDNVELMEDCDWSGMVWNENS